MKPAYVSVEFWRKDREDTATIEGWMTTDFLETRNILITPSIDYDEATQRIAISWDKIISITPAQSVREYNGNCQPHGIILHQSLPKNWREEMIANLQKEIDRNE